MVFLFNSWPSSPKTLTKAPRSQSRSFRLGLESSLEKVVIQDEHKKDNQEDSRHLVDDFCPAGFYLMDMSNNTCRPVGPGYFSIQGDIQRYPCDAGSFSNQVAAEECLLCAPGTFADQPGSTKCQPCLQGSFTSDFGAVFCTSCNDFYFKGIGSDFAIILSPEMNGSPKKSLYCLEPVKKYVEDTIAPASSPATMTMIPTYVRSHYMDVSPSPSPISAAGITAATSPPATMATTTSSWGQEGSLDVPTEAPIGSWYFGLPTVVPTTTTTNVPTIVPTVGQDETPSNYNDENTDYKKASEPGRTQAILLPILVICAILGCCFALYQKPLAMWWRDVRRARPRRQQNKAKSAAYHQHQRMALFHRRKMGTPSLPSPFANRGGDDNGSCHPHHRTHAVASFDNGTDVPDQEGGDDGCFDAPVSCLWPSSNSNIDTNSSTVASTALSEIDHFSVSPSNKNSINANNKKKRAVDDDEEDEEVNVPLAPSSIGGPPSVSDDSIWSVPAADEDVDNSRPLLALSGPGVAGHGDSMADLGEEENEEDDPFVAFGGGAGRPSRVRHHQPDVLDDLSFPSTASHYNKNMNFVAY